MNEAEAESISNSDSDSDSDSSAMPLMPEQQNLIGYPITLKKFILFNVLTLGLFELVWAFKHFRALKGPGKAKTAAAVVFALFLPLSLFDMMKEYETTASEAK